jgi:hypothetical protein
MSAANADRTFNLARRKKETPMVANTIDYHVLNVGRTRESMGTKTAALKPTSELGESQSRYVPGHVDAPRPSLSGFSLLGVCAMGGVRKCGKISVSSDE